MLLRQLYMVLQLVDITVALRCFQMKKKTCWYNSQYLMVMISIYVYFGVQRKKSMSLFDTY